MKGLILLFLIIGVTLQTNGQRTIAFYNEAAKRNSKTYFLPVSVTCTFIDGSKKRLMLEKIIGDSLVFRKYYNEVQVYDCSVSKILKMTFHKKTDYIYYSLAAAALGFTAFLDIIIIDNYAINKLNNSDIFLVSKYLIAINCIGNYYAQADLPKSYKTSKWKIYAK